MALPVDSVAKEVPTTVIRPVPKYKLVPGTRKRVICSAERIPLAIKDADTISARKVSYPGRTSRVQSATHKADNRWTRKDWKRR